MSNNLIAPFRYAIVEKDLYRGAYPRHHNFRFLKRLKLKTIISLVPKSINEDIIQFCKDENIKTKHFDVDKFKEGEMPLTTSIAQTILEALINVDNLPIFIHCLDGVHVTGIVIMLLRKLQCWNLSSVIGEFCRFVRGSHIHPGEAQFVERFRGNKSGIKLPPSLPIWLWKGKFYSRHPTMRIQLHAKVLQKHTEEAHLAANASLEMFLDTPLRDTLAGSGSESDEGDDGDDDVYTGDAYARRNNQRNKRHESVHNTDNNGRHSDDHNRDDNNNNDDGSENVHIPDADRIVVVSNDFVALDLNLGSTNTLMKKRAIQK